MNAEADRRSCRHLIAIHIVSIVAYAAFLWMRMAVTGGTSGPRSVIDGYLLLLSVLCLASLLAAGWTESRLRRLMKRRGLAGWREVAALIKGLETESGETDADALPDTVFYRWVVPYANAVLSGILIAITLLLLVVLP